LFTLVFSKNQSAASVLWFGFGPWFRDPDPATQCKAVLCGFGSATPALRDWLSLCLSPAFNPSRTLWTHPESDFWSNLICATPYQSALFYGGHLWYPHCCSFARPRIELGTWPYARQAAKPHLLLRYVEPLLATPPPPPSRPLTSQPVTSQSDYELCGHGKHKLLTMTIYKCWPWRFLN
jgi:hypothetical protein